MCFVNIVNIFIIYIHYLDLIIPLSISKVICLSYSYLIPTMFLRFLIIVPFCWECKRLITVQSLCPIALNTPDTRHRVSILQLCMTGILNLYVLLGLGEHQPRASAHTIYQSPSHRSYSLYSQ